MLPVNCCAGKSKLGCFVWKIFLTLEKIICFLNCSVFFLGFACEGGLGGEGLLLWVLQPLRGQWGGCHHGSSNFFYVGLLSNCHSKSIFLVIS